MDFMALVLGLALPWCLGSSLLLALDWPRPAAGAATNGDTRGHALRLGYGYFIGLLLLTLWMRALAFAGVGFARLSIGGPLLAATVALLLLVGRRKPISLVAWRPLYPWDAWTQWATKARVWYELSRIVPFVPADVWLAGQGGAFFDAAP